MGIWQTLSDRAMAMMVIAFILTGALTIVRCATTAQCRAGDLIAMIMRNGESGLTMRRRFLIPN
jgi:hypothetical protein